MLPPPPPLVDIPEVQDLRAQRLSTLGHHHKEGDFYWARLLTGTGELFLGQVLKIYQNKKSGAGPRWQPDGEGEVSACLPPSGIWCWPGATASARVTALFAKAVAKPPPPVPGRNGVACGLQRPMLREFSSAPSLRWVGGCAQDIGRQGKAVLSSQKGGCECSASQNAQCPQGSPVSLLLTHRCQIKAIISQR